jgi:hypothetical protein
MSRHLFVSLLSLSAAVFAGCNNDSTGVPTETFHAALNGANERPDARTTPATGTADFTLRRDTLFWVINMSNITNVSASHIHIGDANTAAGILLPLTGAPPISNTHIEGFKAKIDFVAPAVPNAAVTFDQMIDLMRTGGAYVNVHTNDNVAPANTGPGDFPGGEMRGQISPS